MKDKISGDSLLIIELGLALLLLASLSFFYNPTYEKGVAYAMGAIGTAFGIAIGNKFGSRMPEQASDPKVGQTSETTTKTSAEPLPPDTVAK